jgi:S1-C subfamily serine protease
MKIRLRINELEGGREPAIDTADAEVLAALADGTLALDDIDDATLERCFHAPGVDQVVDSLLHQNGGAAGRTRSDDPVGRLETIPPATGIQIRRKRLGVLPALPRPRAWLLAAAVLVVGFATLFVASRDEGAPPAPVSVERGASESATVLALQWPAEPPFDPRASSTWSTPGNPLPQAMPDFDRAAGGTLGGPAADRFNRWRLATVIVKVQNGWGSGALISADGWLLTNYHVVDRVAQETAISGAAAIVEIIPARIETGRAAPAAPLKARLYRADPARDLALLRLEGLAPGGQMAHFPLAASVEDGEDCFVVGSQNNGPAWWIRSGTVSQQFEFPEGLSQFAAGVASSRSRVDRTRATVLVTDARVSSGDSGGPLLNPRGELIGLTFATPANRSAGAVGWHIALQHLRQFTRTLPDQPQAVPFDPWTAGLPMARLLEPELADADGDGRADSLRYRYALPSGGRSGPEGLRAAAMTVFIDFDQRAARGDAGVADRVPMGLWGMEDRGRFRFHVFVTARADGISAVGYTNSEGVVDEIRVAGAPQRTASLVWRRAPAGSWTVSKPANPLPMLDEARIGPAHLPRLRTIAGPVITSAPEGRAPADTREPNVIR